MRFKLSRRSLLLGSAALATATGTALWYSRKPKLGVHSNKPLTTLDALVDTVVPRDEFPGALDLNIHIKLANDGQTQPKLADFISRLTQAVEQKSTASHRSPFVALDLEQREALFTELMSEEAPNLIRNDMRRLRARVLSDYYSSVEGQSSIGYQLPALYPAYRQFES